MFADPKCVGHGLSTSTDLLLRYVSVGMRAQEVATTQERVERDCERREPSDIGRTQL